MATKIKKNESKFNHGYKAEVVQHENRLFYGEISYLNEVIERTVCFVNQKVACLALNKRIRSFNRQFERDRLKELAI